MDNRNIILIFAQHKTQTLETMSKLKTVLGTLSLMTIPENALLDRIVRELDGREAFKDSDTNHNERIYHGDVFEAIINDFAEMEDSPMYPQKKVMEQLEELAEIVSADYVLITV